MGVDYVKPAMMMAILYGMKYIDAENPTNVIIARIFYFSSVLFSASVLYYIKLRINKQNDQTPLTVSEADLDPSKQSPLAALTGATPEPTADVTITNKEYDETKWKASVKETMMSPAIVLFIHFYFGMFPPLIISAIMSVANVMTTPLAKVYIWSLFDPSVVNNEDLQRPWKAPPGLMQQFQDAKNAGEAEPAPAIAPVAAKKDTKADADRRKKGVKGS